MARWPSRSGSGLARSSASQTSLGKRKTIEAWTDASPRPSHACGGIRRERALAGRPPEGGLSESETFWNVSVQIGDRGRRLGEPWCGSDLADSQTAAGRHVSLETSSLEGAPPPLGRDSRGQSLAPALR